MTTAGQPKKNHVRITFHIPAKDAEEIREYARLGNMTLSEALPSILYEAYNLTQENERLRTELNTLKATADL